VDVLADKLRRPPADDFRVVIMLPGRPNTGEDDTRGQLALLAEADGDHGRFLATTIRARSGNTNDRVYVHAKVGIVDDRWLTLGSANLNRPLLLQRQRGQRRHLRRGARATHDCDCGPPISNATSARRPIAAEQRERANRGEPLTHGLVELKATSRRSERLLGPLQALLVDGYRMAEEAQDVLAAELLAFLDASE
jgi:hypothetical protein